MQNPYSTRHRHHASQPLATILLMLTFCLPLLLALHQDAARAGNYLLVFQPGQTAPGAMREAARPGWRIIRLICLEPVPMLLVGATRAAGAARPRTPPGALAIPMPGLGCGRPTLASPLPTTSARI